MAHSHAHSHGEESGNYFLDQLFTILVCGALGLVAILMYRSGMLGRILVPMFFIPVLVGGIVVMLLALIRAVAVWQLAGNAKKEAAAPTHDHAHDHGHNHSHGHDHGQAHNHSHSHGNEHSHGEACGHDHAHGEACGHDHGGAKQGEDEHDHDHDHGWTPLRYGILLIPVILFFLGLPRSGFVSEKRFGADREAEATNPKRVALAALAGSPVMMPVLRKLEPEVRQLPFKELATVAGSPSRQELYEGDIGVIRGQFMPLKVGGGNYFTLFRMNMTCCAADAVPLEVRIESPDGQDLQSRVRNGDWIWVRGIISFQRIETDGKKKWIPVITLLSNNDISEATPTNDTDGL